MKAATTAQIEALLEIGRYEDAIKSCHQLLASEPDDYDLLYLLIRAHLGTHDATKADAVAQRMITLAPDDAMGFFYKSISSHLLKRFDDELSMAQTAVQMEPDHPFYIERLAEAQLQSGMVKEAKESCQQLVKLVPDSFTAHELMGNISYQVDAYPDAEQHYRAALAIDPNAIHLLNQLAITLRQQKRELDAIDILFSALKIQPNDSTLRHNLFEFIKTHLDKNTLKGQRKKKFQQLPNPVQQFYKDYQKRTTVFQRYSDYTLMFFWIALLALATLLVQLFT